jgi:hypothetical protein
MFLIFGGSRELVLLPFIKEYCLQHMPIFGNMGLSIALGNQVCNPICADLPTAPIKSKIQVRVMAFNLILQKIHELFKGALAQAKIVEKCHLKVGLSLF